MKMKQDEGTPGKVPTAGGISMIGPALLGRRRDYPKLTGVKKQNDVSWRKWKEILLTGLSL